MQNQSLSAVIFAVVLGFAIFFYSRKEIPVIRVERTVAASADTVWKHWTETESIKQWWGPKFYTAPVIKSELHEGGTFLFAMQSPEGKLFWNGGRYQVIDPKKKIIAKMFFADENGKPVPASTYGIPGTWKDDITLSVEFTEKEGKTTIRVREDGVPTEMAEMGRLGWEQQFDKFEELLKANPK
jgi:uncharacterized protein YndB with AHSA1/START domain